LHAKRVVPINFPKRTEAVTGLAFSHDDALLAIASWDETLTLWDIARQRELKKFVSHLLGYTAVTFSKDDRRLVAGTGNGSIILWDLASYQEVGTLQGHEGPDGLQFADDDALVSYKGNELILWRATPFHSIIR
jgi:WD40 repeat protein